MAEDNETRYRMMLLNISTELQKRDVELDMLKCALFEFIKARGRLDDAKTPFELFMVLDESGHISKNDISLLNALFEILGLAGMKDIIVNHGFQASDVNPSAVFSSFCISIVDMGHRLNNKTVQQIALVYKVNKENQSNQWKLLHYLQHDNRLKNEEGLAKILKIIEQNKGNDDPSTSYQLPSSQDEKIKEYLLERQQIFCSNFKQFTPPIMQDRFQLNITHMFTDLDLVKEDKKGNQEATPITLNDVLQTIKSTPACKVLIEGEGGIGKTTLLRHLAYDWSKKRSDTLFEGKIVFLVNIRDIQKEEDILDVIVKQIPLKDFSRKTNLPKDSKLIEQFLITHDNEIVLMLDGLDELEKGSESPISIFKKQELQRSVVLITSRSININEFIHASNIHVKVKGFNEDKINEYIDRYFETNSEKEVKLIQQLRKYQHEELYSMCRNPMLLLLTCIMWEEKQQIPDDKANLFKEIFRCILNQYSREETKPNKISKFEDIPKEYVEAMCALGNCMYKRLKKNQLLINKKDLEANEILIETALKLGFVYKDESFSKTDFEETYAAPHKLIVESLVGYYLYKLCENTGLDNLLLLDDKEWEEIRENEHLRNARMFAIGFLGANAGEFLKNWITNNLSTYRSLNKHINKVKQVHVGAVIQVLTDHMDNSELEIKRHQPDVCGSLRKFIHHIDPNASVNENENIISLIQKIYETRSICQVKEFCNEMSSEEKGKRLAHCIVAVMYQERMLEDIPRQCNEEVVENFVAECEKLNIKYDIGGFKFNATTTASFLGYLLTHSPHLFILSLNNITNINDAIEMYSSSGIKLHLWDLDISGNDLCSINGTALASILSPRISKLNISNCNLTGEVINNTMRECSRQKMMLKLEELNISGNYLNDIEGISLASFVNHKLRVLDMHNCKLRGKVINDMMTECSRRRIKLKFEDLNISGNNFQSINALSITYILTTYTGYYKKINISNCNLTGKVINDMISECCRRRIKLHFNDLNISGNNLSSINVTPSLNYLLASLLAYPFESDAIRNIDISNCTLSGELFNKMMRCFNKLLKLENLNISGNDLSSISPTVLSSIIDLQMYRLDMHNCNLTGKIINETMGKRRFMALKLTYLNISGNNLSDINAATLASFVNPLLREIDISNSKVPGEVINHVMKTFSGSSWRKLVT